MSHGAGSSASRRPASAASPARSGPIRGGERTLDERRVLAPEADEAGLRHDRERARLVEVREHARAGTREVAVERGGPRVRVVEQEAHARVAGHVAVEPGQDRAEPRAVALERHGTREREERDALQVRVARVAAGVGCLLDRGERLGPPHERRPERQGQPHEATRDGRAKRRLRIHRGERRRHP